MPQVQEPVLEFAAQTPEEEGGEINMSKMVLQASALATLIVLLAIAWNMRDYKPKQSVEEK